jgi:hypothetical protein
MNIEPGIINAAIGAGAGITVSILANLALRGKNRADAIEAMTRAVNNIIDPLNNRVSLLEKELASLNAKLKDYLKGIKKLIKQIRDLGCEPAWTPDELILGDPDRKVYIDHKSIIG